MLLQISATCCSKHLKKFNWRNKVLLQTSARCCYKHLELVNWRKKGAATNSQTLELSKAMAFMACQNSLDWFRDWNTVIIYVLFDMCEWWCLNLSNGWWGSPGKSGTYQRRVSRYEWRWSYQSVPLWFSVWRSWSICRTSNWATLSSWLSFQMQRLESQMVKIQFELKIIHQRGAVQKLSGIYQRM